VRLSVRVFGSYQGDFGGCPRGGNVDRVVCFRGIARGGDVMLFVQRPVCSLVGGFWGRAPWDVLTGRGVVTFCVG
jgi:hypothetical protein